MNSNTSCVLYQDKTPYGVGGRGSMQAAIIHGLHEAMRSSLN